jgi:hypothetical protein
MPDAQMPDLSMLARVHVLLADAVARLDRGDLAARIDYCRRAHDEPGVRMLPATDDNLIEFRGGGRTLAMVHRDVLLDDGPVHVEHIAADVPDAVPDHWAEQ